jgi:multicomponent Na+:H+ antiporter subunit B
VKPDEDASGAAYGSANPPQPEMGRPAHHEKTISERFQIWSVRNAGTVFYRVYRAVAWIFVIGLVGFLLAAVSDLPSYGDPDNPANNEVLQKYIEDGIEDTGAVNLVSGMILDYRAFDTFGESTVLFAAAGAVIILLRNDRKKKGKQTTDSMFLPKDDVILQTVSRYVIPVVLMFGIYVVLNGHLSPGGGFSGGAVMGAALILFYNAFGAETVSRFFTYRLFNTVTVCALGFYAVAKSYSFYTGANQIHSIIPNGTPGNILSSGLILPLNICVGVIVCCTMFGFYSLFDREVM